MNSEEVASARARPQSRRGTGALASLVHRDFKELLLQWRKRSGQWHVAIGSKSPVTKTVNSEKSDNRYPRLNRIRQAHRFNDQTGIVYTWPKRNEQHLIFIVLQ